MAYDEDVKVADIGGDVTRAETDSLDGKRHGGAPPYVEGDIPPSAPGAQLAPKMTMSQAPPLVQAMSPEERQVAEFNLKRKIDLRLLPMLVIMYVVTLQCSHLLYED